MNAIEFVKECGIDVAKRTLNNAIDFGCAEIELFGGKYVFRTDDLKQIVDAFELVESKGGLVECKKILSRDNFTWCSGGSVYDNPLKRAVNLVEQYQ